MYNFTGTRSVHCAPGRHNAGPVAGRRTRQKSWHPTTRLDDTMVADGPTGAFLQDDGPVPW